MSSPQSETRTVALVGGTGPEGRGLALRLAVAGHDIIIGSRSRDRARETCVELVRVAGDSIRIAGETNEQAAEQAEIIILTIPYAGVGATVPALLDAVQGKIVVSAVAPVEFEEGRPVARRVEAGSAAQEVAQLLPGSRVVSAFQTVDAHVLADLDRQLDTDVLVASDDAEARHRVMQLAGSIEGVRALSAGRLASSRYVEECTALLITLNRIYKTHAGIRITGVNR